MDSDGTVLRSRTFWVHAAPVSEAYSGVVSGRSETLHAPVRSYVNLDASIEQIGARKGK